jgi:hypothetical protein
VLVGDAHGKTWWRNFRRPYPVRLGLGGQLWKGTASVTRPGTAEFHAALDLYHKRFPRVRYRPGDQVIAITLESLEPLDARDPLDLREPVRALHGRWARWMYHGGRPNRMAAAMNRFWQAAASAGIWPSRLATLEVRGRRSGRPVRLPVVIADYGGERYLVAMLGDNTSWAANVRAANGNALLHHGDYEAVHLEEVEAGRRAPVLRRYLQVAPGARPHIPVGPQDALSEFDAIAARYPVFRIDPASSAVRPLSSAPRRGQ